MKITEPKTPYVRYDAETDTVMDLDSKQTEPIKLQPTCLLSYGMTAEIPGFELGAADPMSYSDSNSESGSNSQPTSRRGSEASEKMVKVDLPEGSEEDDDEDEDSQDPESQSSLPPHRNTHPPCMIAD